MKGLLALLVVSIVVSGCAIKTRDQRVREESQLFEQENRVLLEAGVYPTSEYFNSSYGKTHDLQGFIRLKNAQKAKAATAKRAQFDRELPALLKRVESCVLGNYNLTEQQLVDYAKSCFPNDRDNGLTPPAWRKEVIDRAVADLSPHFAQVREQVRKEARQRAAEDRAEAAQAKRDREAEAKRAYDNSLRSLVE